MRYQVLVVDSAIVPHADDTELEAECLRDCASVQLLRVHEESDLEPHLATADGLILWHQVALTARSIQRLSRLKVIVRNGVGYETVDIDAANSCGVTVCNVPDYGTEEVADHAMALSLALQRQLPPLMKDIAEGNWRFQAGIGCRRSRSLVFGIVGCGRIGTAVALRAKAFGYQVRFFDPYKPSGYEKAIGIGRANSLEDLLAAADIVSLHVPLTAETHYLIDEPQLRRMKPSAYLINTARGAVVRFDTVERALRERWIAGAGLDVLEHEPEGAHLASRYDNCVVTPHSAFYSQEAVREMRQSSACIVRAALLEDKYTNVVNNPRRNSGAPAIRG